MAQTKFLPRMGIALGLPDVPTLLDHARREAAESVQRGFPLAFRLADPRVS